MLLLLSILLAHPHAGADATGIGPIDSATLESTFGLLTEREDMWSWTCHEAITTPEATLTPRYVRDATGALFGVVHRRTEAVDERYAVYQSNDGGCSWSPVQELVDQTVTSLAIHDDGRVTAVVPGMGLMQRTDDTTWSIALEEPRDLGRVFSERATWVTVQSFPIEVWIDAGAGWINTQLPPETGAHAAELLDVAGDRALVAVRDPKGNTLWETTDGGATWTFAHQVEGSLSDAALRADGGWWLVEAIRNLWHREGLTGVPSAVVSTVPMIGVSVADSAPEVRGYASASLTGGLVHGIQGDGTISPWLRLPDVTAPLDCPPESDHVRVCEPLWPLVQAQQPEPIDTGLGIVDVPEPPPCGCVSGRYPAGWWWLAPLVGLARRQGVRRKTKLDALSTNQSSSNDGATSPLMASGPRPVS